MSYINTFPGKRPGVSMTLSQSSNMQPSQEGLCLHGTIRLSMSQYTQYTYILITREYAMHLSHQRTHLSSENANTDARKQQNKQIWHTKCYYPNCVYLV